MTATNWRQRSVRGFLAEASAKSSAQPCSEQTDKGRVYRIKDDKASPTAADRAKRRADAMQKKHRNGRGSTKTSVEDEIADLRGLQVSKDFVTLAKRPPEAGPRSFNAASVVFNHGLSASGRAFRRSGWPGEVLDQRLEGSGRSLSADWQASTRSEPSLLPAQCWSASGIGSRSE